MEGTPRRLTAKLKLPDDLPEGDYTVNGHRRSERRPHGTARRPNVSSPQNVEQVLRAVHMQTEAKRTRLTLRVPLGAAGVAVGGKSLPDLPAGVVQILGRRGAPAACRSPPPSRRAKPPNGCCKAPNRRSLRWSDTNSNNTET